MKSFNIYRKVAALIATLATTLSANAFSAAQYNIESVLKEGKWVRVKVTQNGIHQFTDEQLREMGFSNPEKVTVYGYGGAVITSNEFKTPLADPTSPDCHPEDLPQIYSYHANGRLLFYGEGNVRASALADNTRLEKININRYSNYGCYFLTDSKPARSIPSYAVGNGSIDVTEHSVVQFQDYNVENPTGGGAHYFSRDIIARPGLVTTFNVDSPIDEVNSGYLSYVAVAKHDDRPQFSVGIPEIISGKGSEVYGLGDAQTASNVFYSKCAGYLKFTPTLNASGNYDFTIAPYSCSPSYAAIDWVYFTYRRNNDFAGKSQMNMVFPGLKYGSNIWIDNATATTEVWDVTMPYYVRRYRISSNDSTSRIKVYPDRNYNSATLYALHLVAFDYANGSFPTPEVVGEVEAQNLHGMSTPNMVIITTPICREQAERLAEIHRKHQGMEVAVVEQQQVFNEFSSGTPTAMAYRRFIKMLWDRNSSKLKHLLLFGEGSYDNARNQFSGNERLMTYQTEEYYQAASTTTNYCSDAYFGMLADYFEVYNISKVKIDIAVGRIPAGNAGDAKSAVNKIENYFNAQHSSPYRNRALIMGDDGDLNKHVIQSDEIVAKIQAAAPATTTTKAYVGLYPKENGIAVHARELIANTLQQGQSYVCYTGHGNPGGLTLEELWNKSYINKTSYSYPPFWMLSTCDTFTFDQLNSGFGEQLIYQENGGGIAVVGAGRTVYADSNHILSTAMATAFFSAKPGDTLGELYRTARNNAIVLSNDVATGVNTLCYNFGGDPAIPVFPPTYKVNATSVNGVELTDTTTSTITPLADNTIAGVVTNGGQVATSFNGKVTISIYDGIVTHPLNYAVTKMVNGQPQSVTVNVTTDEHLLTEISVPVTNGRFSASFTIPQPTEPGTANRITFYAANTDETIFASGINSNVSVGQYDADKEIADTQAPIISEFYIDDIDFADGDEIDASTTVYATIRADRSGINTSTGSIGGATTLSLDRRKTYSGVRSALKAQPDGSYTISMPIKDLADGRHTLTLSVCDNIGNCAERTIAFTVVTRSVNAALAVDNKTTRSAATISLTHDFSETPSGRLVIEDADGNTVFSRENCAMPFTWNLTDSNGDTVPDGLYRAYAILNAGNQYANTPKCDIVVIK